MYMNDPTNAGAMSAGHQINDELWPTHATWSQNINDSGVYCATTPGYGIYHVLTNHGHTVAMAASKEYRLPGIAIYEITQHHPQYITFQNRQNPNFASCPNKVDISAAVLAAVPTQLKLTLI